MNQNNHFAINSMFIIIKTQHNGNITLLSFVISIYMIICKKKLIPRFVFLFISSSIINTLLKYLTNQ